MHRSAKALAHIDSIDEVPFYAIKGSIETRKYTDKDGADVYSQTSEERQSYVVPAHGCRLGESRTGTARRTEAQKGPATEWIRLCERGGPRSIGLCSRAYTPDRLVIMAAPTCAASTF